MVTRPFRLLASQFALRRTTLRSYAVACSARPSLVILAIISVCLVVGMSTWAMRFRGIRGARSRPAMYVDVMRHEFQMQRIDAMSHTAEMIDFQSVWNGADEVFVGESVRIDLFRASPELPISDTDDGARPEPAAIRLRADLREKSVIKGASDTMRATHAALLLHRGVSWRGSVRPLAAVARAV
jgi:hypothetical protein